MVDNTIYDQLHHLNRLRITTLGSFQVLIGRNNLVEEHNNSLKIWELFKYLVTFRDELILPEKIISAIWSEADYSDPKRTLRSLVFRLRKILNAQDAGDGEGASLIVYSHGCYKFDASTNCHLDAVEFEEAFHAACAAMKDNPAKAVGLFKKSVDMYRGDYLTETVGHAWLIPARNHYRRIFLQSVYEVSDLLKDEQDYEEILKICEKVLKHEIYEEEVHFRYIEALAALGKIKQAKNHYKYVEEIFERGMGVKPSNALQQLYRMLFGEIKKSGLDITSIAENLREEFFTSGPMLCEAELFKFLHNLEKRRSERYGQTTSLAILTLSEPDHAMPAAKQLQSGMEELKQTLLTTLRKGDVVAEWNEAQFLVNLPVLNVEQAHRALERVLKKYAELRKNPRLALHYKIMEGLPVNNVLGVKTS